MKRYEAIEIFFIVPTAEADGPAPGVTAGRLLPG